MRAKRQTTIATTPKDVERQWWVVDARGKTLGRLASQIAPLLKGKNKPYYAPYIDTGDFVIVVNCEKIHTTGNRMDQKRYYRHSGYPGGLRSLTLREMLNRHPDRVVKMAVRGMLPKGPLGRDMLRKLRVYSGEEHPHEAQKPEVLEV